ncbi:MAG: glycosyltransferase [Bacteroidetes bacterium]|nr:glycosyltransferase [Bacteroidota bacterium]
MIIAIITIFLLFPYIILIAYYRKYWLRIENYKIDKQPLPPQPYLSVIIAARNEENNIGACLNALIDQHYPIDNFEIIVTNDHSTDATAAVVKSFDRPNIILLELADYIDGKPLNSYKKKSIETALAIAKGELIVTTDADCIARPYWLQTLATFYCERQPVFIAMPVAYSLPQKSSFLKKFFYIFQALDFMALQGITGASAATGIHNMCNGANLAYTKDSFYAVNGFDEIQDIASGDDMLLMEKIQKIFPDKISYLKSQEVIVTTHPSVTVGEFFHQRIRWASKADRYTDKKITAVLVWVYFLNVWLLTLAIASFFSLQAMWWLLSSVFIKIIMELFFLYPVARFFKNEKLLWWFIPCQPFHIFYTVIAGWLGKFGNYRWKGRNVK